MIEKGSGMGMCGGLNHRVVRDIYQVLASYPAVKKSGACRVTRARRLPL